MLSKSITIDSLVGISWSLGCDGLVALVHITDCNNQILWYDDIDDNDTSHPDTRYRAWSLCYLIEPSYDEMHPGDAIIALCDDSTVYYPGTVQSQSFCHITVEFDADENGVTVRKTLNKWCIRSKQSVPTVIKRVCIEGTMQQKQFMDAVRRHSTKRKRKRNPLDICDAAKYEAPPKKRLKLTLNRKQKVNHFTNENEETEIEPLSTLKCKMTQHSNLLIQKRSLRQNAPIANIAFSSVLNKLREVNGNKRAKEAMSSGMKSNVKEKISKLFEQNRTLLKKNSALEQENKRLSEQNMKYKAIVRQLVGFGSNLLKNEAVSDGESSDDDIPIISY